MRQHKPFLIFAVLLLSGSFVPAQSDAGRLNLKNRQVVIKSGDTLWDLSGMFYDNPWLWPRIWYANPPVENPHLIFPGQILNIPEIMAGTAPEPVITPTAPVSDPVVIEPVAVAEPESPDLIEEPPYQAPLLEEEIPFITEQDEAGMSRLDIGAIKKAPLPTQIIRQIGNEEFLLDNTDLEDAPRLLKPVRERTMFAEGDSFWINRGEGAISMGQKLLAARKLNEIESDRTDQSLGFLMSPTGMLEVVEILEKIARVTIIDSYGVVEMDNLLFQPEDISMEIAASPKQGQVDGEIVAMAHGAVLASSWQRIFIDLGEDQGMKRGDILTVYRAQDDVEDTDDTVYKMPNKLLGSVVVVSTSKNGATGLIIHSLDAIHLTDRVTTPGL